LHDFEGGTSANDENVFREGECVIEEGPTDDFIEGIVAADVFAENLEFAGKIKECGGVNATRFGKGRLSWDEFFGYVADYLGGDFWE
jgi:predicted RNA-binding protein